MDERGSIPGRGWDFFSSPPPPYRFWGPPRPPIKWVTGALSPAVRQPGRGADHSPPSSAEVKNLRSFISTLPHILMEWCLVKHRANFTFTFRNRISSDISLGMDWSRLAEQARICGFLRLRACPSTGRCLFLLWCSVPWTTTWTVREQVWWSEGSGNRGTLHASTYTTLQPRKKLAASSR